MKDKLEALKHHIHDRRGRYAAAGTVTLFLALGYRNTKEWNEFLKEHGVYDAYHEGLKAPQS